MGLWLLVVASPGVARADAVREAVDAGNRAFAAASCAATRRPWLRWTRGTPG